MIFHFYVMSFLWEVVLEVYAILHSRKWEDISVNGLNKHLQFVWSLLCLNTCTMHHSVATWVSQRLKRKYTVTATGQGNDGTYTKPRATMQADLPSRPLEHVVMDILGPVPISNRGSLDSWGLFWQNGWSHFPWLALKLKRWLKLLSIILQLYAVSVTQISLTQINGSTLVKTMCRLLGIKTES